MSDDLSNVEDSRNCHRWRKLRIAVPVYFGLLTAAQCYSSFILLGRRPQSMIQSSFLPRGLR
jgi:hypothetical protein